MSRHRFKVGQAVHFSPGRLAVPASGREYKVLKLMPFEGGDLFYRIKSVAETFERVARESELTPASKLF
jgi:hypothetical protein